MENFTKDVKSLYKDKSSIAVIVKLGLIFMFTADTPFYGVFKILSSNTCN